jgi:translation initiation factor IF-1
MQETRAAGGDITDRDVEDEGVVVEALPNALYRVELASHERIVAHASRDAQRNFVRILVGDRVSVARAPRNRTRGRITERLGAH